MFHGPVCIEQNKEGKKMNELDLFQTSWSYFDNQDLDNLRAKPQFNAQERGTLLLRLE